MEMRFSEEGSKGKLPSILYVGNTVLCMESEEDLRVMIGRFVEVCSRRGLKVNPYKS